MTVSLPKRRRRLIVFLALIACVCALPLILRAVVVLRYSYDIMSLEDASPRRVAIVFGAAVYPDGEMSDALRHRMTTAIDLYHRGVVSKLVVSGDNRFTHYDEPTAMMNYAASRGVPTRDIQPDFAGRRTYDTCYRAKHVFGIDSAILVTQEFHLPRALFVCGQLDVEVIGVPADDRTYSHSAWDTLRETAATSKALIDVVLRRPAPVLGDPVPIK